MKNAALKVVRTLRSAGHQALLAGGCVRDTLLGREPKDFDVATDATPDVVKRLFPGALLVGAAFGVVVVRVDGIQIEVATFRTDGEYRDGRRPESVRFATALEDAQRRDFTVNGLFMDPETDEVIDHVGGRVDMEQRIIRAIGEPKQRFTEDHLRLLRAVRFATVLGFEIETTTWTAITAMADHLGTVSAERIRDEFSKIMLHPNRVRGFDLLVESGLIRAIIPEILVLQGCEQPPQFHPEGDVFIHTRLMLSLLPDTVSINLVLSVLLHDIAKPATQTVDETGRIRFNGHDRLGAEMTAQILRRLKYSNEVVDPTVEAVDCHMRFIEVKKMRLSKLKRFMARPHFDDELALHRVDCLGSNGLLDNYSFLIEQRQELSSAEPLIPPRLITGADLIALGWHPGKALGALLGAIQTLQLEGTLSSREEALAWIAKHAPTPDVFDPPPDLIPAE